MEKKYLLPKLVEEVELEANCGWENRERVYDFLIDNMFLHFAPNTSVFEGGSNAVPHMFEQMLLFHKAFLDDKNPEHNRAVMEWRAVLSIMALQRVCNVYLDLVRVDLSGKNNSPFLKAAYNFRPEDDPVFHNTTWEFLYIVRLKKVPIAIFSPVTLVCPAKMFLKKVNENLENNWLSIIKGEGGEQLIFDFQGERKELSELREWLNKLRGNLSSVNGECEDKYRKIIKELKQFADMCGSSIDSDGGSPFKERIYDCINNSIQKQYDFFNNCCEVRVKNEKLRFLVERYLEDVFGDKVLVLVYDDAPDTMEKEENIYKLEELYRNILYIEDRRPIIEVRDNGGRRKAACVFLPFKSHFVSELIQNHITPNEFFGSFDAIYHPMASQMEVVLQIKGFPYCFRKKYSKTNWEYIYGRDIGATYIWPTAQIDAIGWKNYYIYTEETKDTQIEVSVPEAVSQVKYINRSGHGINNTFQLCKSHSFPAYLCYTCKGVRGYVPIWTKHLGTNEIGATASVIVDLGHATTSISIFKEYGGNVQLESRKEGQDVSFWSPRSTRIVGDRNGVKAVNMNFVIPDEEKSKEVSNCIKNMMHCFRDYDKFPIVVKERRPFEDGQILFDSSAYLNELQESIVSYINFEYALMDQIHREKVHIFIEQLLVYAVYQIIIWECSYVRVYFLHGYEDGDSRLGELKGLWNNALANVRQRTGINSAGSEDTIEVKEHEALACYVYEQVYKENMADFSSTFDKNINIGMNIGWKNTNVVILSGDQAQGQIQSQVQGKFKLQVKHAALEYAGRNISMLIDADNNQLNFPIYPKILQILLGGQDLEQKPDIQKMLMEFSDLFGSRQKDVAHYQGVFDSIAKKIDEEDYHISPDVFNNMPEFRYYVMAVTYNIMLLFISVGVLLKSNKSEGNEQVNIYLGGNGAKFLKWISNFKDVQEIERLGAHELLILPMKNGIMEYFAEAAGLDVGKNKIRIILADKPEEQLVQGCRTMKLDKNIKLPEFESQMIDVMLSSGQCQGLVGVVRELRREVFRDFPGLNCQNAGVTSSNNISVIELIENERKAVCSQVTSEINSINNKPYNTIVNGAEG